MSGSSAGQPGRGPVMLRAFPSYSICWLSCLTSMQPDGGNISVRHVTNGSGMKPLNIPQCARSRLPATSLHLPVT